MRVGSFLKARYEHARNQRKTPAQIKALQLKKFRRIVAHANAHSPYYRDLIKSLGLDVNTCLPTDFPPLTKSEAMANFDRIVTDRRITLAGVQDFLLHSTAPSDLFLGDYTVIHTSGSSGTIGYFVASSKERATWIALALRSFPFSLRRRRIAFYGVLGGHYGGATSIGETRGFGARMRFDARALDLREPFSQVVDTLNEFQPQILSSYPSAMKDLATAQAAGQLRVSPDLLSVGGEVLTKEDRAFFESVFGAPISNHYGTSEHATVGYGLSKDNGIYLFEDELIIEIEEDRTLVTNLFRYTQPLIRYQMDDRLELIDDPNRRLPFTKIKDLGERAKPSPVFTDKHGVDRQLKGQLFAVFFVPDVEQVQLRVSDKESCILRVKLRDDLTVAARKTALAGAERQLTAIFEENELGNVSRRIDEVKQFVGWKPRLIIMPDMTDTPPVLVEKSVKTTADA